MSKLLIISIIINCSIVSIMAQYNKANLSFADEAPSVENQRFTYKNLRLYPITARESFNQAHQLVGDYLSLKDALSSGKAIVIEQDTSNPNHIDSIQTDNDQQNNQLNRPAHRNHQHANQQMNVQQRITGGGGAARVNGLFIENKSNDTLLILAGEVVKGGKQDRVIAQDMLIPPKSGLVNLSVFCVEKSRWSYKTDSKGFGEYFNVSNMSVRATAAGGKGQTAVWDEVDKVTKKQNVTDNSTGSYTSLATSTEWKQNLTEYVNHFTKTFENEPNIIGVVVVTGDKVLGCDMFATPALFRNHFSNLLHSYITEAITHGAPVTIKTDIVSAYLDKILLDENKQEENVKKNGTYLKNKNAKIHISTF